jgi:DNA polymerase
MTAEDPRLRARRIATSLRAALEVEAAFGTTDLLLPERTRPAPTLPSPRPETTTPAVHPAPAPRPEPTSPAAELPRDLEALARMVAGCTRCHLHETRRLAVFGAGDPDADLMVVGEAPGADEDRQGVPFVGKAGQLLTRMLLAIDLPRDRVFICNVLKCRPPGNRTPDLTEIAICLPYLRRQIELIRPKVILALGTPAARTLLDTRQGITKLRGRVFPRHGARCVPSFHPAYLLRNPAAKRESWADLRLVRRLLHEDAPSS